MPVLKTLNKDQRLKSRKAIDALFKNGRSFSNFPFRVLYLVENNIPLPGLASKQNDLDPTPQAVDNLVSSHNTVEHNGSLQVRDLPKSQRVRAGFSAPSKNFKKAVDRNRIKRFTKEAYRVNQEDLNKTVMRLKINLILFLIFTGKELPDQELVTNKILVVLQTLIKKLHESHSSNT